MKSVFTVDQIRRAENKLLAVQDHPDELMMSAATAVAAVARAMLTHPAGEDAGEIAGGMAGEVAGDFAEEDILLLVGSGGNGGDALYAGAFLASEGHHVDALLLGGDRVHERALEFFTAAGGTVVTGKPPHYDYCLVIDGILGIGGRGGIQVDTAQFMEHFYSAGIPVLAVDIPSGVDADTGALPEPTLVQLEGYETGAPIARQKIPTHINADVTITFGGLRRAHAVSAACGYVLMSDIRVNGTGQGGQGTSQGAGLSLAEALQEVQFEDASPTLYTSRAWRAELENPDAAPVPPVPGVFPIGSQFILLDMEPTPESDKYTGGVVGIVAGSAQYLGAAVLACSGAVRATSSMVRFVGDEAVRGQVLAALPEVVATPTIGESGRVQSWVYGPGRGTGEEQVRELATLFGHPEPVLVDADGITLIARSPELLETLRHRAGPTVLTPHKGEFERLADALREAGAQIPSAHTDPIGAALAAARELDCCVLLKGRATVVATSDYAYVVNAGHSWSATPGSGDVLSGLVGAHLARSYAELSRVPEFIPDMRIPGTAVYSMVAPAVSIHAVAAILSARTEFGHAPTSASRIAEHIPAATARANANRPLNS
ncbi:putative YjeF domain protein [Corynebacterium efficiens YS-314]|nr:bifunctional ADP-dependent NAD(P)H-hydrate dehydratase/NAD(P)H-hydrate epimerase [Corynebacterium efficiens]EEW50246.1 putative YjeF domain protein [Corynebacterium efficiens YS-314]